MSKPTVIFEGLNCVGKSSLIDELKVGNRIYVHNNRAEFLNVSTPDAIYGYMKAFIDILNFSGVPMWFDRFHFTEYSYGVIKRGYDEYTASKIFAEIDYRLSELGNVRLVYLYDNVYDILKRTEDLRGWGDLDTIKLLNERMERCCEASCIPILAVNYKELSTNSEKRDKLISFVRGE